MRGRPASAALRPFWCAMAIGSETVLASTWAVSTGTVPTAGETTADAMTAADSCCAVGDVEPCPCIATKSSVSSAPLASGEWSACALFFAPPPPGVARGGLFLLPPRKRLPGVRFVTDGVDLINRHRLKISFASRVMDDRVIPDDRGAIAVQTRLMNAPLLQAQLAYNAIVGAYLMRVAVLDFAR